MERTLGLMAGAGILPALIAERARGQGWRVVEFAFPGAADLGRRVERVIPSLLTEAAAVLEALSAQRVTAAVLCGRFSMPDLLRAEAGDAQALELAARAGARVDVKLVEAVIGVLASVGVEVLDQRVFLGDLLLGPGCWSRRAPTEAESSEIRRGLGLARLLADQRIGQTIVLRHGAVAAVEAGEGTTEAIRRGTALGGGGGDHRQGRGPRPRLSYRHAGDRAGDDRRRHRRRGRRARRGSRTRDDARAGSDGPRR